ncbi:SIR2 family protein [Levilactobacillus sp. N40-8-2]|uniref:SIR2 family protein n=1 Tax=Levilactobacillus muriae TaxID=3238987 RepID=UPI0038B3D9ED
MTNDHEKKAKNNSGNKAQFKIIQGGLSNHAREVTFDQLKSYLQPILSEKIHINFLIGSGSSLPAIPIMGTTFSDYKKSHKNDGEFNNILKLYYEKCSNEADLNNIELFLSWLANRVNGLSQSELGTEQKIKDELTKTLIDSITKGYLKEIKKTNRGTKDESTNSPDSTTTNYELFIRRTAKLRESTSSQFDTVNLFTTNYDLFLENALDGLDYAYTDGFRAKLHPEFNITEYSRRPVDVAHRFRNRWSPVSPFFRVYKLHGSINWIEVDDKIEKKSNIKEVGESVVIAPTTSKYADSQGAPYSDLFRELSVQLLNPNSLLVVNGFGFGDEHINELIIQALGRSDFALLAFVKEDEVGVTRFMEKVRGNTKVTFITNGKENDKANYFSTLVELLAFEDPFEVHKNSEDPASDK